MNSLCNVKISKIECIDRFNQELEKLLNIIDKLNQNENSYLDRNKINLYVDKIRIIRKANSVKIIESFLINIYKFKDRIYEKDLGFFKDNTFDELQNHNEYSKIAIALKSIICDLDDNHIDDIWDSLIILTFYTGVYKEKIDLKQH